MNQDNYNYHKLLNRVLEENYISIDHEGLNLGRIKIKFEENEDIKDPDKGGLLWNTVMNLLYEFIQLKRDIELALRVTRKLNAEKALSHVLARLYLPYFKAYEFTFDAICDDDYILKLISSEGPAALRNFSVQLKLAKWIKDKNTANSKLNKLCKSLLEYSFGTSFEIERRKEGRPEKEIKKKYGTKWIIECYQDMREALSFVKKNKDQYNPDKPGELIAQAFTDVIKVKQWSIDVSNLTIMEKKIYSFRKNLDGLPFLMDDLLKQKNHLKNELEKFNWQPNKLAKILVQDIFGLSESQLEKIPKA